jgi:hypothetical protein
MDSDLTIASQKLQTDLLAIQNWFKKMENESQRIQVDSCNIRYTKRNIPPPPVHINNVQLPQEDIKYLGLHLDRRLTWHKHIFAKRKQLGITLTKMYWLLKRKSKLSTSNKLLIYKTILIWIWTYGIQLWGMTSTSNIGEININKHLKKLLWGTVFPITLTEILERFKLKTLRMIVVAPWYVPKTIISRDLQIPTVKEEICCYSSQCSAHLSAHPNDLIVNLIELPDIRKLRRHLPNDLPTRFLV